MVSFELVRMLCVAAELTANHHTGDGFGLKPGGRARSPFEDLAATE